jgi:hypothetical protein
MPLNKLLRENGYNYFVSIRFLINKNNISVDYVQTVFPLARERKSMLKQPLNCMPKIDNDYSSPALSCNRTRLG